MLPSPIIVVALICLLLSSSPLNINIKSTSAASSVFYDFVASASAASWTSGAGSLPFPGSDSDSSGCACYKNNAVLEDDSVEAIVLETHPQWVSNGWIMGKYPQMTIPTGAELKATIGFFKGATGSDGVTFKVQFDEGQKIQTIISYNATYDGKLDSITQSLDSLSGRTGQFILYVNAGQSSGQDWAAWVEAKIEVTTAPPALPDLVITDVWASDSQIGYTLKNIGQGSAGGVVGAPGFYNALFIDGQQVAEDLVTLSLAPGEQLDRYFEYQWEPSATEHTVKVCADQSQEITESDETNNCWQDVWVTKLPDLMVDRVECTAGNKLSLTIKNIGSGSMPGGWIAIAEVYFDDVMQGIIDLTTPSSVDGGGIDKAGGSSTYLTAWDITAAVTVTVIADANNDITEANEQNNSKKEALTPKTTTTQTTTTPTTTTTTTTTTQTAPPLRVSITSGPTVSDITQSSVVIRWQTNTASDSLVSYDRYAGKFNLTLDDASLVTEHRLTLKQLEPATTYHFYIESRDASGNMVKSRAFSFETPAADDNEKPTLSLAMPDTLSGKVILSVEAQDNIGIDRVVFFCDGKPMLIDYSFPFAWELDTLILDEGEHSFSAQAFDAFGNKGEVNKGGNIRHPIIDPTAPSITFINPSHGDNVSGSVSIESLIEDAEGYIQKAEMYIDGVRVKGWVYTPFSSVLSGGDIEIVHNPPTNSLSFDYLWDTAGLDFDSEHLIEVRAWDNENNYNYTSIEVRKPALEALYPNVTYVLPEITEVQVTRNVVTGTNGNWFEVWLYIRNTGNTTLDNLQIRDACIGFQAIPLSADTIVDYSYFYKESLITITPTMGELRPGETWTFVYHVVPILFSPYNPMDNDEYVIGLSRSGWMPQVLSIVGEGAYQYFIELPYTPAYEDPDGDGISELDAAFKSADYLIVTSEVLLRNSDYAGVDLLLQKAATLAREKRGVLAFWYPSPSNYDSWQYAYTTLKTYISPGTPNPDSHYYYGYWASRLSAAFSHPDTEDAYLLLIGEWDVIPSATYDVSGLGIRWTGGGRTDEVRLSDNFFADTVGNDKVPDLIVGRILGETPDVIVKPIQASLDAMVGAGFDRASAVVASGYEAGSGDSFVSNANNVASDLAEQGVSCELVHWGTFIEHAWGLPLNNYDAFALGDVDADGIDEVIIAKDEENKIYIYEPADRSLVSQFTCDFGQYDALAAGDLEGDGSDVIIIASVDNNMLYVYSPYGIPIDSFSVTFDNWDAIAIGDVVPTLPGEEIVRAREGSEYIYIYHLIDTRIWGREGWEIREESYLQIREDFTAHDCLAVGNVLGDDTTEDEILIASNDDNEIYIYRPDGWLLDSIDARFTRYDGFAVGDVDDDNMDEMIVIIDEDDKIYLYQDNGRYRDEDSGDLKWTHVEMYTRDFDNWFDGIRYTASDTRYDGVAIGNVIPGENGKLCIMHIVDDSSGSFCVMASSWDDADRWANRRLGYHAGDISFLIISGHGNPGGPSPIISACAGEWGDFTKHPLVFSMSCLTGYYRGDTFGDSLFDHGAAVFIGSTEVSARTQNNETVRKYFDTDFGHYWNIFGASAGKAFRDYERYRTTQGSWWKFWVYEYNYYGDPKFPFGG